LKKTLENRYATIDRIIDELNVAIQSLKFSPPVSHVYNPLDYARQNYIQYWRTFGFSSKEVILLGMNPGPWGMAQTGVPFGHIGLVRDWLGICGQVKQPKAVHPKRPIQGFSCTRQEVSGKRLWGWAKSRFKTTQRFFKRFWVANYCPLVFMEESGRNRTPDKLPKNEKSALFSACDEALRHTVALTKPKLVIGVGAFAANRARVALSDMDVNVGQILHPSPANPKANQGWERIVEGQFSDLGIHL
jgi:single-strand selective monofunctional uracil DNA glycosylase